MTFTEIELIPGTGPVALGTSPKAQTIFALGVMQDLAALHSKYLATGKSSDE